MRSVIPFPNAESEPNPRVSKAIGAIRQILEMLDLAERQQALKEIEEAIRPIPAPRAGKVLAEIVQLLPSRRFWTAEDIKQQIAARGISATPKAIYNSLGYLVRTKRIKRVGYGRYLIEGGGLLETADDLGIEPARDEESP
jgi:hypothetical protein